MAFYVELRLLAACFLMRPLAPLIRHARRRLVADAANRCSDFPSGVSLGSDFLYLRAAGAASANVDERDSFSAVLARPWHWSLAEQRARSAGGALQSQVGFHTHTQVRHRTQIATLANLQVPAAEISPPARRTGFRDLFHLLPLVRDCAWTVSLGALPAHVPRRLPLCLYLFVRESLAQNQFWRLTARYRNFRVTRR